MLGSFTLPRPLTLLMVNVIPAGRRTCTALHAHAVVEPKRIMPRRFRRFSRVRFLPIRHLLSVEPERLYQMVGPGFLDRFCGTEKRF
jgi:hypothetical protein